MGTIEKRGELQWQAKVRRNGAPSLSRRFMYKEDAEKWGAQLNTKWKPRVSLIVERPRKSTFAEVLKRYQK